MELIIAEKPSVGKVIAETLGGPMRPVRGTRGPTHIEVGDDIVVTWSFGHALEMAPPERYDSAFSNWEASEAKLPIVPSDWQMEPISSAKEQLGVIGSLLKKARLVVHAGDPDREGQLLIDEILEYFGNRSPVKRILPNAMDSVSMKRILADRRENTDFRGLYEAALGRQRADWYVGMNFTRSCTLANQRSGMRGLLSVGRVQTPTLAIVVKRDLEIDNFVPVPYFDAIATFRHANGTYRGRWKPAKTQAGLDAEGRLIDERVATALATALSGKTGSIAQHKVDDRSQRAPLPFSLSTLTTKASAQFGMGAQMVLDICQRLYEVHKVATYPRTDCQYLPQSQLSDAGAVLQAIAGFEPVSHLTGKADRTLRSPAWNDAKVTAHHAIVPTTNANYAALSPDEAKVFSLICKNYLAQFYPDYTYKQTSVLTEVAGQQFRSSGRVPIDLGWRRVFGADDQIEDGKDDDVQTLPAMSVGDNVQCEKFSKDRKLTEAPAAYTEGTLLRAMTHVHELADDPETKRKLEEIKGIGTEATRSSIIELLKKRQFLEVKKGKIRSTPAARAFIQALPKELTDPAMTAMWESLLDKVESRDLPLDRFLDGQVQFVTKMTRRILGSQLSIAVGVKSEAVASALKEGAGAACSACGKGTMRLHQAKKGDNAGNYFLGCSNFPDCKQTEEIKGQEAKTAKASSKRLSPLPRPTPFGTTTGEKRRGGSKGGKSGGSGSRGRG